MTFYNIQAQEEADHRVASEGEWDQAAAYEIGGQNTKSAWVLTDRDVWHANPFYQGEPQPHPEDYQDYDLRSVNEINCDDIISRGGPLFYSPDADPDCPF